MPSNIREMMEALRVAIGKATPGPWSQNDDHPMYGPSYSHYVWGPDGPGHGAVMAAQEPNPHAQATTGAANAKLAALANPQTLTLLLQHVEKLEEALKPFASLPDIPERFPDTATVQAGIDYTMDGDEVASLQRLSGGALKSDRATLIVSVDGLQVGDFRKAHAALSGDAP